MNPSPNKIYFTVTKNYMKQFFYTTEKSMTNSILFPQGAHPYSPKYFFIPISSSGLNTSFSPLCSVALTLPMKYIWASLVAQWERIYLQCRSHRDAGSIPGREDPLEESKATHSTVLAWRIPCTEEPARLQSIGLQRVGRN